MQHQSFISLVASTTSLIFSLIFAGKIPTSIFTLPALQQLDLSENQLCGTIHEFNGASSHLKWVYLRSNELIRQIPQSLLVLPNLTDLDISRNNLMGLVDLDLLWRLEKLTSLFLSHNKLLSLPLGLWR